MVRKEEAPEIIRGKKQKGELEPIGDILAEAKKTPSPQCAREVGKLNEAGRTPHMEKKWDECVCQECGGKFNGEITVIKIPGTIMAPGNNYPFVPKPRPPREYRPEYCPACQEKFQKDQQEEQQREMSEQKRRMVENWRKTSGITRGLAGKTFENFDKRRQVDAYKDALEWAREFDLESPAGYPSLLLYSAEPGLGKTHLMVSIANYLFDNWDGVPGRQKSPILFVKGPELVRRIRWTYHRPSGDYQHEREEDIYQTITGVPLLLLDDVGKETPSMFTRDVYWYIIDERLTNCLPVIITSRLPFEGEVSLEELMGKDTVDRLYGMTRGELTEMTGSSYRREKDVA